MGTRITRFKHSFNGRGHTVRLIHARPHKRHPNEGTYCPKTHTVTIYAKGTTRTPLQIAVHETLHAACPWMAEDAVERASLEIGACLARLWPGIATTGALGEKR